MAGEACTRCAWLTPPLAPPRYVDWEFAADASEDSLSVMLTGNDKYKELVPGVTQAGMLEPFNFPKMGYNNFPVEQDYKFDKKRTQAALVLVRDPNTSSTNSIQATHIMSLETPVFAPVFLYWELSETPMPLAPHETIDFVVPMNMNFPTSLYEAGLDSNLNTRCAPVCYILTGSEVPVDYGGEGEQHPDEKYAPPAPAIQNLSLSNSNSAPLPRYDKEEVVVGHNDLGFEIKEVKNVLKPRNMNRRRMTDMDDHGYRQNLVVTGEIIRPVTRINPAIFGITAKGASANKIGVGGRTIWHSEQRCVEQLCRMRTPFDFLGIIRAKSGSGFCDPRAYSMLLKGYSLSEMVGVGEKTYNRMCVRARDKLLLIMQCYTLPHHTGRRPCQKFSTSPLLPSRRPLTSFFLLNSRPIPPTAPPRPHSTGTRGSTRGMPTRPRRRG